jgi:hypothetical protein
MLFGPAAVGAPELLGSPADGRVPMRFMPLSMPVVPVDAGGIVEPGPTLPSLDAPGAG